MKKRWMTAMATGALVAAMLPGAASAESELATLELACYDADGDRVGAWTFEAEGDVKLLRAIAADLRYEPETWLTFCEELFEPADGYEVTVDTEDDQQDLSYSHGTAP
jgi:hypothetical protein